MPRRVAARARPGALPMLGSLLGLAALFSVPLVAQPADSRERALEEIRAEIAGLQAQLSRVQQQEQTMAVRLRQTALELDLQERRLEESRAALELARAEVTAQEAQVAAVEEELERVRSALGRRLVALYRLGRAGYLRLLVSVDDGDHTLPAVRQVRYLARRDGQVVDEFVDAKVRLELEHEELAEERARVEAWVVQEEQRRTRLAGLRREQARLLARAERERESLESRAGELEDKERKLANFIAFLYGRAGRPLAGTPIQDFAGVLDWPVEGRVTVEFGPRRDDRYGTIVPHNGITVATRAGEPVRAVYPGKILFAAHFKGYGPTAIVHHAGRAFTLYAGLADLRVDVDDMVALGQVVGAADDSIYFEIRIENRPEDPRSWLRR